MIEPFDDLFFCGFLDPLLDSLIVNADCELYDVFHFNSFHSPKQISLKYGSLSIHLHMSHHSGRRWSLR